VHCRWRAANNDLSYPKLIPLSNYEEDYLLIMELRFDAVLYSNSANAFLMRAISNVYADRICPEGRRFPTLVYGLCLRFRHFQLTHAVATEKSQYLGPPVVNKHEEVIYLRHTTR